MHKLIVRFTNEQERYIDDEMRFIVKSCAAQVLTDEKFPHDAELSVTFTTDRKIHKLNRVHRNVDRPTDVLSFPLGENGEYDIIPDTDTAELGDIVISMDTAARQAQEYGHSIEREVAFLTVHSMLHLLGYDHIDPDEEREMHEKEDKALSALGITRGISPVWAVEDIFSRLSLRKRTMDHAAELMAENGVTDAEYSISHIACEISEDCKPYEWYSAECVIHRGDEIVGGYTVRYDTKGEVIDDELLMMDGEDIEDIDL
ncbi:MAG: rRNA maturation RNase YbeY [Oscillospiraceae bacterium]|nr:rRNA maturation RNase YbeY [Oscillospiraceae bacterium]